MSCRQGHCSYEGILDCPNCRAIAGAYWLGMIGFGLAAPAATARAVDICSEREMYIDGRDDMDASMQVWNCLHEIETGEKP